MNKKKLLALVLAALMSVSATVVAFADESTPAATQNAGITVLSEEDYKEFVKAPLDDQADALPDESLAQDYVMTYSESEGVYNVTLTAKNLQMHTNGNGTLGYWIGIAVTAPEGKDITKVKYDKSITDSPSNETTLEPIKGTGAGGAGGADAHGAVFRGGAAARPDRVRGCEPHPRGAGADSVGWRPA